MDIKYIPNGEEDKTCADCKHFERDINMQGMGKCFGREVLAEGSCNFLNLRSKYIEAALQKLLFVL